MEFKLFDCYISLLFLVSQVIGVTGGAVKPSIKNIVFVAGLRLAARKEIESLKTISTCSSGVLNK